MMGCKMQPLFTCGGQVYMGQLKLLTPPLLARVFKYFYTVKGSIVRGWRQCSRKRVQHLKKVKSCFRIFKKKNV